MSVSVALEKENEELELLAAEPAGDAVIVARGLSRSFNGGIDAVRGLDLTVGAGEVFGFLGPNGAGKTTTVRMLCTLLPPTAGICRRAGRR
jgi:ABC-2 type transport system ATP-binding protein